MKGMLVIKGSGLLLVGTLTGCGPTGNGSQAAIASPTRTATAGKEAMPNVGQRPAPSPAKDCRLDESVLFACRIGESSKVAMLCMTRSTMPVTTYRFGDPMHPELTVTDAEAHHSKAFHRTPLTFAGATGGYVYSIENGNVTHAVYAISGDAGLARAGVAVVDATGHKAADLKCDLDSVQETESLDLIRRTRSWAPDPAMATLIQ